VDCKVTRGSSKPNLSLRNSNIAVVSGVSPSPITPCAFALAALNIMSVSAKNIIFRMFFKNLN
jgi:hypothetical protein